MQGSPVTAERDGPVGLIRLDHPQSRNTLTAQVLEMVVEALEAFDADPGVRCVVLAGTRDVFAIGGDVADADNQDPADLWRRLREPLTPTIAAVSGQALGGGWELALSCDLVIATDGAEFGQPEIALGLIPGGGATQRLTRLIGRQRTMELVLTGRRLDTQAAERLGLVNQVVRSRDWLDQVMEVARFVAARPPLAARLAKQAVLSAEELPLTSGMEAERRLYRQAMATEDRVEAMQAYREKRKPQFEGR
jgi:enoyl-CoA hydratase/carnithine racemase